MENKNKFSSAKKRKQVKLLALLALGCVTAGVATGCKKTPTDYANDGNYYISAIGDEYSLSLSDGMFALTMGAETKIGKYTFKGDDLKLVFADKTTATAVVVNGVVTLSYNNATYNFVKKVAYAVSYSVDGTVVNTVNVMNGKTVAQPADPVKEGYTFVGWYADQAFTTPFAFGVTPISANTTVYARFVEKVVGQDEFKATFVVDGEVLSVQPTINGVLHELPTPEKANATFAGWWMSDAQSADKLTAKYEGQTLKENVNLYAVWENDAPLVSVTETGVKWNSLGVGVNYNVVVYLNGSQVKSQKTTATNFEYDFTLRGAASYKVEVSANDKTATAYFNYKELDRVSNFTVVEPSMLVFNAVENAEKYLVTVDCGNDQHTHTLFDNGSFTHFNFANCDMQEGGIQFTVTAVANGYTSSVSDTFSYERKLSALTGLTFDAENGKLQWNSVEKATSYVVEVTQGTKKDTYTVSDKSFSMKGYSGAVSVKVSAVSNGYTSSFATLTYTSEKLASPTGVTVSGNEIKWSEVAGAVKYNVMLNGVKIGETDSLSMAVPSNYQAIGLDFVVSVQAVGETEAKNSYYSDDVEVKYGQIKNVIYTDGMLKWAPVGGAAKYEYMVNNQSIHTVSADATSTKVKFTEEDRAVEGDNVIIFKAKDAYGNTLGEAEVVVKLYELRLESRSSNGFTVQWLAIGDEIDFTFSSELAKTGYDFDAWYNVPGGAESNGSMFEGTTYMPNTPYTLYAYWTSKEYEVTLKVGKEVEENGTTTTVYEDFKTVSVYYDKHYSLPVPDSLVSGTIFNGWSTSTDDKGYLMTDAQGDSVEVWTGTEGRTLYATWTKALNAVKTASGNGVTVSMASGIQGLKEITIPETFTIGEGEDAETLPVVAIAGEAFANCQSLEVINIPDTVETIFIGEGGIDATGSAFFGCRNLKEINVYATEGVHETFFSSVDGVLLRHAQPGVPMENGTELYFFPAGKKGVYEVPNEVQFIPQKTFSKSKITDIIIPASVSLIGKQAFERSNDLKSVVFAEPVSNEETVQDLVLSSNVFAYCYSLVTVDLPARLAETSFADLKLFEGCTILREINIVGKGGNYTSKDGMICDASGRQIIYCPIGKTGDVEIPASVQGVAEGAFTGCTKITKLIVGGNVATIDKEAFMGCRGITTIEFRGEAGDLSIGEKAFYGCTALRELELSENVTSIAEMAFGNTPLNTRVYLKAGANIQYANNAFIDDEGVGYVTDIVIGANMGLFEIRGVFAGCSIKSVTVEGDNANYASDSNGVLYNSDQTQILFYPKKFIENYALPETVTTISAGVFENNRDFTSFVIGKNVTTIGANAFKGMTNLQTVTFDPRTESLTIGDSAFEDCAKLQIVLPETLDSIGAYAFKNCTSLTSVTLPASLTKMGNDTESGVFDGCTALESIDVKPGCEAFESQGGILYGKTAGEATELFFVPTSYKGAVEIPSTVRIIPAKAFFEHEGITQITFAGGVAADNFRIGESAFAFMKNIEKVILPKNLSVIPASLFEQSGVKEIFVPNTVNTIELKAFYKCASLDTLTFEEGNEDNKLELKDGSWKSTNTAASEGILYGVPLATSGLVFPERLQRIPNNYFYKSSFTSVTIPASIEYIGSLAFNQCASLTAITFAGDATTRAGFSLGNGAFSGCTGVKKLTVPASIKEYFGYSSAPTTIGSASYNIHGAFRGMSGLTELTFEEGVTTLAVGMFYGSGLTTTAITLPDSLVTIGDAAFATAKFNSVTFGKNLETIGKHAFSNATSLATVDFSANQKLSLIGDCAFEKCVFTTLVLPDNTQYGVTELTFGKTVFIDNTKIETATIPATVKSLNSAFAGCSKVVVTHVGNESAKDTNGFVLSADGKRLVKYEGQATEITVPAGVEIIGDNAFSGKTTITKVVLPDSLKVIEGYAFKGCSKLATVEGGKNLISVGNYAFSATIIASIDLSNVTSFGDYAFKSCTKLTSVILNDDLAVIPNYMFDGCSLLASIDLPANLTTLGFKAFNSCSALTSIVLPEKLTHSDMTTNSGSWFSSCSKLASVTIKSKNLGVLPYYAFMSTAITSIEIPEGVTDIVASFSSCSKLKTITFPSTLKGLYGADALGGVFGMTAIETLDFSNTSLETFGTIIDNGNNASLSLMFSLKKVIFPTTLTSLSPQLFNSSSALQTVIAPGVTTIPVEFDGSYYTPFKGMTKLTTVEFSPELVSICKDAFYGCTSLTNFTFPDSLKSIGDYAFYNTKLADVAFGENLETVGEYAFYNTLVTEFSLPASLTQIGTLAFGGCKNLTSFEVASSNPRYFAGNYGELYDNTNTLMCFPIGNSGNDGVVDLTTVAGITLNAYAFSGCTNIQTVILPVDIYEIPEGLFENSSITEITIPSGVTSIGGGAFYNCTGITEIVIPENVNTIGEYAFYNCSGITEIIIPANVTSIGDYAFYNCSGISEITIPANVATIGEFAFTGCTSVTRFVVASGNVNFSTGNYGELYDSNNNLIAFPAKPTVEGGVVTLATGLKLGANMFNGLQGVTEVVLPTDLAAIPAGLFANSSITKVTIPATVTSIDSTAFTGMALQTLIFADGRTSDLKIAKNFFKSFTSLTTLTMGNRITEIGDYAFDGCTGLTTVTLSSSLTKIGQYAFRNCSSLTGIAIPNTVSTLSKYAFDGCSSMTTLTLSTSLTSITEGAFRNCSSLTAISLPGNITSVAKLAFSGCSSATSITLSEKMTSIGESAFANCTGVTYIVVPYKVATVSKNAFQGWTNTQTIYIPTRTSKPGSWNSAFAGGGDVNVEWGKNPPTA